MTDNEIIKALECCRNGLCTDCPRLNTPAHILLCKEQLMCEALDLINRQKAEIEQLKIKNRILSQKRISFPERLEIDRKARNEAVKEFADRLCDGRVSNDPVVIAVKVELKEMVGEANAPNH